MDENWGLDSSRSLFPRTSAAVPGLPFPAPGEVHEDPQHRSFLQAVLPSLHMSDTSSHRSQLPGKGCH